jgi:NADP-reducing hydrogenase subunit HndB
MKSLEELRAIKERAKKQLEDSENIRIVVGMATCGIAAGAKPVFEAIADEVAKRKLKNVAVVQTGCIGVCQFEPVVEVYKGNKERVTYVKMDPQKAIRVINDHIVNDNIVTEYTVGAVVK